MKNLLLAITLALAGCTAANAATEECCMPPGQGQIFASGISILLKGPNEALQIADGNPPVKYLHFVGADGQTIVPTYEPDGLDAGQGSKIAGAKLVIVSAADLAALEARIAALEAVVVIRDGYTYLKNPQGQIVITLGQDSGQRTLAFFDGQNPQPQVVLDPGSSTLQDVIYELNAKNLTAAP